MTELKIEYRSPAQLNARPGNPRTHSEAQIRQLMRSIEHFGFTNPVLVDERRNLIAGHGRVEAAKRLGLGRIPTISLAEMSDADIRAYVIADNRLAENAGWDDALLAAEFQYLQDLEIDFDLTLTGFELPEIDFTIQQITLPGSDTPEDDAVPAVRRDQVVSRAGDVWCIGPHRLICGDARNQKSYDRLLEDEKAHLIFSDPPYNVPVNGHIVGGGRHRHEEFAMASGEMTSPDFTKFLQVVFERLAGNSHDGSIHYQCMDWRHLDEILEAGRAAYSELKNLCVWSKTNGGMGSLYRSQHELVFVFKSGSGPHTNNVELGKNGRNRTNIWNYPGANTFGEGQSALAMHPTVKPVALIRDAIMDCSHRGQIVLDPFCGSGSTLIAAEETGRAGRGIEFDPAYCDVIVRRMAETLSFMAFHEETGREFAELEDERAAGKASDELEDATA